MQAIYTALKDVQRGVPVTEGELSMIPLLNESAPEANYLTFEAAVKRGGIMVEELSESGSVPVSSVACPPPPVSSPSTSVAPAGMSLSSDSSPAQATRPAIAKHVITIRIASLPRHRYRVAVSRSVT